MVLSTIIVASSTLSSLAFTNNSSSSSYSTDNNDGSNRNIGIFLADSKPYGLTYGEWTARWWQWAYSIPKNINPAYDDTGKNCAQKQDGPVWFLAGTFGHYVNRICDIPDGKTILLPILNSECSFAEFPKLNTMSELRTCAKTIQDQVIALNASIDGTPLRNLEKYRVQSPPFNFTLSQNNILGMPTNITTQAIADGNWVFLKPLSPGFHKIMFKGGVRLTKLGGSYNNVSSSSFAFPSGWDYLTTYNITVMNSSIVQTRHHRPFPSYSSIPPSLNQTIAATSLGTIIFKENAHLIVSRIVKVTSNSFTIESTYRGNGVVKGAISITDIGTDAYIVNSTGQFAGKGQGLLRTSDGGISMAAYTEELTGYRDLQGKINAQGTMHFTALATGKLANLSNTSIIFKVKATHAGDLTLQSWEQK